LKVVLVDLVAATLETEERSVGLVVHVAVLVAEVGFATAAEAS
jgi:hypothetical protein